MLGLIGYLEHDVILDIFPLIVLYWYVRLFYTGS